MTSVTGTQDGVRERSTSTPTDVELTARQLSAVAAFHSARRMAEQAAQAAARSRELRMDAQRRLAVLQRQHEALVARSHEQLTASARLLGLPPPRRAVLAHRNAWFAGKVSEVLTDSGITVVACTENGADAVGLAVAEQPDLVLVEDTLAMVAGEEVVRSLRQFCPETLVAAQVAYSDRVAALRDAGAEPVFVRQVPPADVASRLLELVGS